MEIVSANEIGLKPSEIEKIQSVFTKYVEIEKVIIYGSRAKGNYKLYSDIDVTIVGAPFNLTIQHKIETELDDLLLPYKFDLSIFDKIENKDLIEHINRVGKIIFLKSPAANTR
jgi:type I restriction enzyme S subunit